MKTKVEGRKRSYRITEAGIDLLEKENQRLKQLTADYQQYTLQNGGRF